MSRLMDRSIMWIIKCTNLQIDLSDIDNLLVFPGDKLPAV